MAQKPDFLSPVPLSMWNAVCAASSPLCLSLYRNRLSVYRKCLSVPVSILNQCFVRRSLRQPAILSRIRSIVWDALQSIYGRGQSKMPMLLTAYQAAGAACISFQMSGIIKHPQCSHKLLDSVNVGSNTPQLSSNHHGIQLALGKLPLILRSPPVMSRISMSELSHFQVVHLLFDDASKFFISSLMTLCRAVGCGYCLWLQQCGSERTGHSRSRQGAATESACGAAESRMRHVWLH